MRTELEVLVLKLEATSEPMSVEESSETLRNGKRIYSTAVGGCRFYTQAVKEHKYNIGSFITYLIDYLEDQSDFLLIPRHQELLGSRAKDCDIRVSMEGTGLEDRRHYTLSYVLFRCVRIFNFRLF